MSSSAINQSVFQAKINNVQNAADSSGVYSGGVWSFKNSTAVTSVTITDAGAVGIGTASPGARLHVLSASDDIARFSATAPYMSFYNGATRIGYIRCTSGGALLLNAESANSTMTFYTSDNERMRIDASGRLLVGTTSTSVGGATMSAVLDSRTANTGFGMGIIGNASNTQVMRFAYDGTAVGSITITGSATAYNVNSDYRLKEDVQPMSAALSKVAALKPCTYKWKVDGSEGEGFIAHELAEVCPTAVTGEKDAVNEDGSINSQGIDPSKIVALLTAAIQELSAKNDALEARLAALEAK